MSKRPFNKKHLLGLIFFILVWAVAGGLLLRNAAKDYTARAYTHVEIQQITTGLQRYAEKTGKPPAPDNSSVFRALAESNSAAPALFTSRHTNAQGETLDFWGTPYRIEVVAMTNWAVSSAGKNKAFGDGDDIFIEKGQ